MNCQEELSFDELQKMYGYYPGNEVQLSSNFYFGDRAELDFCSDYDLYLDYLLGADVDEQNTKCNIYVTNHSDKKFEFLFDIKSYDEILDFISKMEEGNNASIHLTSPFDVTLYARQMSNDLIRFYSEKSEPQASCYFNLEFDVTFNKIDFLRRLKRNLRLTLSGLKMDLLEAISSEGRKLRKSLDINYLKDIENIRF